MEIKHVPCIQRSKWASVDRLVGGIEIFCITNCQKVPKWYKQHAV